MLNADLSDSSERTLSAPLMSSLDETGVLFYDTDAVTMIPSQVAAGYLTLLTADISLSLPALLDGNVVDAAFGISSQSIPASVTIRNNIAEAKKHMKGLPKERQRQAVSAYQKLFQIIIKYHEAMADAGLVRCCKEGEIRRVAVMEVKRAFLVLAEEGVPPPPRDDDSVE
mmetsp:Transcript_9502/g.17252  ORF Transcript_9502/g.17252 Transcript_9502/m.17252 type:complete len:170 (+) Transcript_9502:108-617(+)